MANQRMALSKEGTQRLELIMAHLEAMEDRKDALRIAFAKGLSVYSGKFLESGKGDWTIPAGVIAKDEEYTLFKHLMMDKLQSVLVDNKDVDQHLLLFIELGLETMEKEIQQLGNLDNYLVKLVENV